MQKSAMYMICVCMHTQKHTCSLSWSLYMYAWCAYRQLNVYCLIDAWEHVQSEVFIHVAACKPRQEQWAVLHLAPGWNDFQNISFLASLCTRKPTEHLYSLYMAPWISIVIIMNMITVQVAMHTGTICASATRRRNSVLCLACTCYKSPMHN